MARRKRKPKLQIDMGIQVEDMEARPANPSNRPFAGARVRLVGVQSQGKFYLSEIGERGFIMEWVDDMVEGCWIPIIELDNGIVAYGHLVRWERMTNN